MQTGGFDEYYGTLVKKLREQVAEKADNESKDVPPFSVGLTGTIIDRLRRITVRSLILEMKVCDQCGMLGCGDEYDRYRLFAESFLSDEGYLKELYTDYKPMYDCLTRYIDYTAQSIAMLLSRFDRDMDEINQRFFPGKLCSGIKMLDGGSDMIPLK